MRVFLVMPAQAGIQNEQKTLGHLWMPASAGMTEGRR